MAPAPEQNNANTSAEHGNNDWLIEEMLAKYRQDPNSVDSAWVEYFRATGLAGAPAPQAEPAPQAAAPAQAAAPQPAATAVADTSAAVPSTPGSAGTSEAISANAPSRPAKTETAGEPVKVTLRGAPMRTAKNMDASLTMPVATSVRNVPMKLVIDQRQDRKSVV